MKKLRLLGLVGAGQLSRSCLPKIPGLLEQLGPVAATSYRLASRLVNSIRAGYPVQRYEDLKPCHTVLISVPDAQLEGTVSGLAAAELDWRSRVVLLVGSDLDSTALAPLAARGASAGSISPVPGVDRRFILEGEREAVKQAHKIIADRRSRLLEVETSQKGLYLAGLCCATSLFSPLIDVALQSFRAAGLHPAASATLIERLFHKTLRAHLRAGRKVWAGPLAADDREALRRQIRALEGVDPTLARFFRGAAALALELFDHDASWLAQAGGDAVACVGFTGPTADLR